MKNNIMPTPLAFGVDLGGTNLRVALVSQEGKILSERRARTPIEEGPVATAELMNRLARDQLAPSLANHRVLGIGVGSPGPLSRAEKTIFQTPNLPGFDNFPLGKRVEELLGMPLWLDNDAKCATFGEAKFGAARGKRNVILLTFGTGIGGGVLADGRMIYGKSDGACELGHLTLHPEGRPCKCGNRGCFEVYVSATAVERRAIETAGRKVSNLELFQAEARGDSWATSCLVEIARDLAIGCASLVNIFEPEMIVFGGGLFSGGGGPLCSMVQENIRDRCFKSSQRGLEIVPSTLLGEAGVLGAASLVFDNHTT